MATKQKQKAAHCRSAYVCACVIEAAKRICVHTTKALPLSNPYIFHAVQQAQGILYNKLMVLSEWCVFQVLSSSTSPFRMFFVLE